MPEAPRDPHRSLRTGAGVFVLGLLLSSLLHGVAVAPYAGWTALWQEVESPGDEGPEDAAVGNDGAELVSLSNPVRISVYQPPRKSTPKPKVEEPKPSTTEAPATGAAAEPVDAEPEAVAEAETTSRRDASGMPREGVQGKPPRGNKKPCEKIDEVEQLGETRWKIERDLLDYYATHLAELEKQAGVATHRDENGKKDGARIYLPRCSILKQGGLRNGDVIHTVNGRKVNTIPQAVATYMAVRGQNLIEVELTRRSGERLLHKYHLR